MEPEIPASSTQIGQDARGVIGQTVIGATVIYGSVTIIHGAQAAASESATSPAVKDDTTTSALTSAEDDPNPYQGLLAFQPSDGDRFFGRATEIEDLWQRFRALHEQAAATRLLVVYGPSGSGKSSLVRAGLVPELARRPPGGRAQSRIALLVPGTKPLLALAGVLARIATNDQSPMRKTNEFAEVLASANGAGEYDGLQRIASLLPEADECPLVVVVDQLEQLYSDPRLGASTRQVFLDNLLQAAADRSRHVSVVVTLRSDFLGATQVDRELNILIKDQGVFVAALSEEALRDAIRLPAERRGRPLDDGTIQLLVEQSLGRDGALPLLQFTLLRIWEGLREARPAARTLRDIGGVGGALAGEADHIYTSLSSNEQRIAQRLFLTLVQMGEGSRDTRRRMALREVIAHGEDPAAVDRVIERYADRSVRLITRSSGDDGGEALELTHEALIEAWPLLRVWLNDSREDLRLHRRLEVAARYWESLGKLDGSLWRPPDLNVLERFREKNEADLTARQLAFAEASRRAEQERCWHEWRTQRLLRGGLVALSGLTLLAFGSGGFAWHQLRQARAAQALQFEATHRGLLRTDPFWSLVYGLAAAGPLLDGQRPWEAAALSTSLSEAGAANRSVSMPIVTGQRKVWSLIELRNGDLISGGSDGTLRRWRDGKPAGDEQPIATGQGGVRSLIVLSSGELISGGEDGTLRHWRDGKPVGGGQPIVTGQGEVRSLIALRNGELISGGGNGTLRRWRDGKPVGDGQPIATGQGEVRSLITLRNGELISGGGNGTLRRWRDGKPVGDGQPIATGQGEVRSLIALRNGELISGGGNGTLRRWRDGKPVGDGQPIATGQGEVLSLIELKNGELISGGSDGTLRRWRDGKPVGPTIVTGQGVVLSLIALKNNGLISGGSDGTLRRWRDPKPVSELHPIATGQVKLQSLIELKNGDMISRDEQGTVRRWRAGKAVGAPIEGVVSLIQLKNGDLISGGQSGTLYRWRDWKVVEHGNPIHTGQGPVSSLIELRDGELISGGEDGTLRRWRDGKPVGDGKPILTRGEGVKSLIELENGELISSDEDGTLQRWRDGKPVGDGRPIVTAQSGISSLIRLKNGELISAGLDGTLRRWKDWKPVADGLPIDTGQIQVTSLIELKNGELISGGKDGTLRRWRDGKLVGDGHPIRTGQKEVWSLIALKNGELISGGSDGTLRRWAIKPVLMGICTTVDLSSGIYPSAMEPVRQAARSSCQNVGVKN